MRVWWGYIKRNGIHKGGRRYRFIPRIFCVGVRDVTQPAHCRNFLASQVLLIL